MWNFLAKEVAKKLILPTELNKPEVYAERIKRDLKLHDYADAWALYDSDRAYWEDYYDRLPIRPDYKKELVRDSAAAAGVSSRNNVFRAWIPRVEFGAAFDR